ncbi:hypothetical protein LIER_36055 [Lithospermum erythrorhizon]|uniref:Uncharacterized protein n=1 Tax=Lithospermum erythrorhizon TaxID=34254 RepID=A0AAV3P0Z3_LITER
MADAKARGKKSTDEWKYGSPKKGRVYDRLEKPKDNFSLKRPRQRSPRRDDARAPRRHPDAIGTYDTPLKVEIEKLIKRGQLREFVKNDQRGSPRSYKESSPRKYANGRKDNDQSPRVTGRVDTISNGIAGGGDTSNARRKYARWAVYAQGSPAGTYDAGEISFSDKELA